MESTFEQLAACASEVVSHKRKLTKTGSEAPLPPDKLCRKLEYLLGYV